MGTKGRITDAAAAQRYILAGKAVVTLRSIRSGKHFTYRVKQPKKDGPHFVSVLTGPDNTSNYTYMGTMFNGGVPRITAKSKITADAPAAKAFMWAWAKISSGVIPAQLEVVHSDCCGRCGRPLTDPDSVGCGLGPVCRAKVAL